MKQRKKLLLDLILLAVLLTLYHKRLISMQYHEVAGLLFILLVLVHVSINGKTIIAMCQKFGKMPLPVKIGVITDLLLILCFVWLGISGVLISHTILTGISSSNMFFKLSHLFAGGLSVLLIGIHIGLHVYRKQWPVAAAAVLSAVILCAGVYGAVNSSELRWLSLPVQMMTQEPAGEGAAEAAKPSGEGWSGGEHRGEHGQETGDGKHAGTGQQAGNGKQAGSGPGMQQPNGKQDQLSLPEKLNQMLMFLGMILSCTMITFWIARPKKKPELRS